MSEKSNVEKKKQKKKQNKKKNGFWERMRGWKE